MTIDSSLSAAAAPVSPDTDSLTALLNPQILADPYPLYRRLRENDPVHWDPYLHAWVVTRYDDIVAVLRDFSAARTPTPESLEEMGLGEFSPIARVMVQQMLFLDAPAHARIRGLASSAFTPQRIAVLRSHIRELVREQLADVAINGKFDIIADLAEPIPYTVTAEMLGVPIQDAPQLKLWSQDFAEMLGNFQHNPGRSGKIRRSVEGMTEYFRHAIQERRSFPREGLIQSFCDATVGGDRFSDEEIIANTIVTMVGGQETTTNLIANGILTLLRYPSQMLRLRDNAELIPSAVEEMLRFEAQPTNRAPRSRRRPIRQSHHPKASSRDRGDGRRQPRSPALPQPGHL